jgi:hypothetical protein
VSAANQYILRAPFSLQKITWKPETQTVIHRSKPHHNTKRNFEIYKATDFLAALVDHIPPKSKHTVRYYGVYSNKSRGQISRIPDRFVPASPNQKSKINNHQSEILFVPPPPLRTARSMRPLWRDLIRCSNCILRPSHLSRSCIAYPSAHDPATVTDRRLPFVLVATRQ